MNDEQYVKKIKTIRLCSMCKPLDDECNNLIDNVTVLEKENAELKKLITDLKSEIDQVNALRDDLIDEINELTD